MEKFSITPVTAPEDDSLDYLPCDESIATRWAVEVDENTRIICATRETAEYHAERLATRPRSSESIWDTDVVWAGNKNDTR